MSDLRYRIEGDLYHNAQTATMRDVIVQQQEIIDELLDVMFQLGYSLSPITRYINDLCLGRTEYLMLHKTILSDDTLSVKKEWLTRWLKENIYEMPEEYIMQMIENLENEEVKLFPEERSEIVLEDKHLEKELRTIAFQQDCVMSDLLNIVRQMLPEYHSIGEYVFELKLTEENRNEIHQHMLYHSKDDEKEKEAWLQEYLTQNGILFSQSILSPMVQAFSPVLDFDFSQISKIVMDEKDV